MARPYDAERFRVLVERLYAAVPELALSTDIIAGFPGETDAEFQETLALARARRVGTVELALVEEGGVAMSESYFELPAPVGAPLGTLVKATM